MVKDPKFKARREAKTSAVAYIDEKFKELEFLDFSSADVLTVSGDLLDKKECFCQIAPRQRVGDSKDPLSGGMGSANVGVGGDGGLRW